MASHSCEAISWSGPLEVIMFDYVDGGGSWSLRRTNPEVEIPSLSLLPLKGFGSGRPVFSLLF